MVVTPAMTVCASAARRRAMAATRVSARAITWEPWGRNTPAPCCLARSRFHPNAVSLGHPERAQLARRRKEPHGILSVDPRFDGMARARDHAQKHRVDWFAGSQAHLRMNQVDARDFLRDRRVEREQLHDGQAGSGFAAAAFAHQANPLAAVDAEGDITCDG